MELATATTSENAPGAENTSALSDIDSDHGTSQVPLERGFAEDAPESRPRNRQRAPSAVAQDTAALVASRTWGTTRRTNRPTRHSRIELARGVVVMDGSGGER